MQWFFLSFIALLTSCSSSSHDQNDPYVIENTDEDYQAPAPYYDQEDQSS